MICAVCNTEVPAFYRGPIGHAPANVCFDCWCEHWAVVEVERLVGSDWTWRDLVLLLVAHGDTKQHAARVVGVHRNTAGRWFRALRENPELIPDWTGNLQELA